MKKVLTVVLSVLMLMSLVACGSKGLKTGAYKLVQMETGGQVIKEGDESWKLLGEDNIPVVNVKDDKNLELSLFGTTTEATYTMDGSTMAITANEETMNATVDGSKITMEQSGQKMIFEMK